MARVEAARQCAVPLRDTVDHPGHGTIRRRQMVGDCIEMEIGPRIEDGEFYNMKMPMFDAQHRRIGILVMEIPCTDVSSEQEAAQKADQIRSEVSAQIPDLQSLFTP